MKITYRGDYALKALLQLALKYGVEEGVMSINEIAAFGDMPVKFLEQILLALRRGGFVKSKRGSSGGFILARPPGDIKVGEVVRFIEGPIEPISCIEEDGYKGCKDVSNCIFRDLWKEVCSAISVVIDNVTFAEIVSKYKEKSAHVRVSFDYAI